MFLSSKVILWFSWGIPGEFLGNSWFASRFSIIKFRSYAQWTWPPWVKPTVLISYGSIVDHSEMQPLQVYAEYTSPINILIVFREKTKNRSNSSSENLSESPDSSQSPESPATNITGLIAVSPFSHLPTRAQDFAIAAVHLRGTGVYVGVRPPGKAGK